MALSPDFASVVSALLARNDWDVVKLNGDHRGGYVGCRPLAGKYRLCKNMHHQNRSGAYMVTRRAAAAYARKMLPMYVPHDHEYIKFWKYGLRGFCVDPMPAKEDGAPSSIDYASMKKNRLARIFRIPHMFYILYIGVRRMLYAGFS
jgi:glycosyl transferase family 25